MPKKLVYLLSLCLIFSCKKERPQPTIPSALQVSAAGETKVFVLNQGVWPNNNSSICLFTEKQGLISSNYFALKNSSKTLGSVPQSMTRCGNYYYLVVNAASKIIVLDTNFVFVNEISNLTSPRYIQVVNNSKLYVSDLYADKLSIINTASNSLAGNIPLKGWSEQMQQIGSHVYVCDYDSSKLYVVDAINDVVSDSIQIGKGAEYLVKDKNNHLWVLCTSIYNTEHKYLKCIDVNSRSIIKIFDFATNEFPTALQVNESGEYLYYINKHVFRMSIDASSLPSTSIIAGDSPKNFYALGIHPQSEHVYVSDSKYGQALDRVYVYSNTGESIRDFESGYITGHFYFNQK